MLEMSTRPLTNLELCSVSDANGNMNITETATSPLTQDMLNHDVSAHLCRIHN